MTKTLPIRLLRFLSLMVMTACGPAVAQSPPLPDTEYTRFGPYRAWLTHPTTRYAHGVLGDAIEAGGFRVDLGGKLKGTVQLTADSVFEDRRVRLHDLDGDGVPEAIVIRSFLNRGSSISVYGLTQNPPVERAASEPIGTPNRWLNIAGIGPLAGDGRTLIAAVITPHLAGSLRFYALSGKRLEEVGRIDGFTNHIIGETDLDLARMADVNGDGVPDIVLPTRDRRALAAISFRGGVPRVIFSHPVASPIRRLSHVKRGAVIVTFDDATRARLRFADMMRQVQN